ncbi:unnamed protein product, partial [marine sediment metagenome]
GLNSPFAGTDKVDGHKAHILDIKDLNKMMGAEGMQKVNTGLSDDLFDGSKLKR